MAKTKVYTNPDDQSRWRVLGDSDTNKLTRAIEVLEEVAVTERNNPSGKVAEKLADDLAAFIDRGVPGSGAEDDKPY